MVIVFKMNIVLDTRKCNFGSETQGNVILVVVVVSYLFGSLRHFITKRDRHYYKLRQLLCYKIRQKFITKCVRFFIKKSVGFNKLLLVEVNWFNQAIWKSALCKALCEISF